MKSIKSKLLISVGVIVLVFSSILLHRTYGMIAANIENLTKQQLSIALNFDLAIREYVAEKVRPITLALAAEGEFLPETMSTSFVARNIFEKVRRKFPDYIIKFSADNPRNPVNKAGPEELNMIRYFNDNPANKVWTGEITMGGKQYYAKFSAMRMEKSCLHCHGDPSDAPSQLLNIYGSSAGFHLPLGKVVGLDTIAIPSDKIKDRLWHEAIQSFGLLGIGILLLSVSLVFIFKFVITDRLSKITAHFLQTERQDRIVEIKSITFGGRDEIATLTSSFNQLAKRLNESYTDLRQTRETLKKSEKILSEINKCFLSFGTEPLENINRLTMLCGELLAADCALYNRLERGLLCSWGQWNTPLDYNPEDNPDGHICYDVIQHSGDEILVVGDLQNTRYAETDPNVIPYNLKTYIGRAVKLGDHSVGSLCMVYQDNFKPSEADERVIEIIASAIGIEEERMQANRFIETSLQEKEVLLREVHHRVKNNFEIISSLLDLSGTHMKQPEIRQLWSDARARIHSMALIHTQLYQSDRFDQIEMDRHVKELVEHISHIYSDSEKIITPVIVRSHVCLSVNQAIPCALVLNELVVNVFKHAFKRKRQGTVHVSVSGSIDDTVSITVKDDGDGFPEGFDVENATGLGLKLVRHLVDGQLRGEMQFIADEGAEIIVTFKKV